MITLVKTDYRIYNIQFLFLTIITYDPKTLSAREEVIMILDIILISYAEYFKLIIYFIPFFLNFVVFIRVRFFNIILTPLNFLVVGKINLFFMFEFIGFTDTAGSKLSNVITPLCAHN